LHEKIIKVEEVTAEKGSRNRPCISNAHHQNVYQEMHLQISGKAHYMASLGEVQEQLRELRKNY
jgi:hypothetical protein